MVTRLAARVLRSACRLASGWGWCCALLVGGCANLQLPRIDPTGEHLFLPCGTPPTAQIPGALPPRPAPVIVPSGQWGISVSPSQVIAPVGSEVVMIASVCGGEGYLLSRQRVEWMLSPDSVGQFLSPGQRHPLEIFNWLHGLPKKVDSRLVVNTTLTGPMTLDRGTPTPTDDILVQSGQSWVSVTSPTEGTSHVTVFGPGVLGWDRRQQTASIYWVDAQWRFPPPVIGPAGGRQSLTTTLSRQTDNAPLAGWIVRYEIAGGPPAGFAPDGAQNVEIITAGGGEAVAEIFQTQAAPGTNQVNLHVIRPTGVGGQTRPLPVGSGSTLVTWAIGAPPGGPVAPPPGVPVAPPQTPPPQTPPPQMPQAAPAQVDLSVNGPEMGVVGSDVQFEIQVVNRGTTPATGLVVSDRFDFGLQHAGSNTPIQRDLADLPPGGMARLPVVFRVMQAGELCQDIALTGSGGLRETARRCLNATEQAAEQPPVTAPPAEPTPAQPPATPQAESPTPAAGAPITVNVTGPDRRRVGETALFTIEVSNRGDQAITDLEIADNFETTLQPARATEESTWLKGGALGWKVASLEPGKPIRRSIEFNCLRETPRSCDRVTVSAPGIEPVAAEACLEIVGQEPQAAPAQPQPPQIEVSVAETADPIKVDGTTVYQILLTNKGSDSAFDVVVTATYGEQVKLEGISGPVQGSVQPGSVRFLPIRELRSGESPLSFELRARGLKPGTSKFHVEVTSRGQTKAVSADQSTEVLP